MRIFHPQTTLRGAERENSFLIEDYAGVELGQGWLRVFSARDFMPDRPLHIYLEMDAHPAARDMLYGALFARALLLRRQKAAVPARIYTGCAPTDLELIHFFKEVGLTGDDGEELFCLQLRPDARPVFPPVGTQVLMANLRNQQDLDALLSRINAQGMGARSPEWLMEAVQLPYFMALGVQYEHELIGEILVTGSDGDAVIELLYTHPNWRRRYVATALVTAAKEELLRRGAQTLRCNGYRGNLPMVRMFHKLGFDWLHTLRVFPGIDA